MHSDPRTTVAFIVNMRRDADFAILLPALRRWKAHRPGLHRAATAALRFTVLWLLPLCGLSSFLAGRDVYRGQVRFHTHFVMMVADQMKAHPRLTQLRVMAACLWAVMVRGADVVVLGAYTSPLTHDGEDVRTMFAALGGLFGWACPRLRTVIVSHGDSLSALAGCRQLERLIDRYDMRGERLAVVGATGIIGRAFVRWYADHDGGLVAVGRTSAKIRRLRAELRLQGLDVDLASWDGRDEFPCFTDMLPEVRLGALCTSHPGELVRADQLCPDGSLWGDASQPNNLARDVARRAPTVAAELSILSSDHLHRGFGGFPLPLPPHHLFACGSEGLALGWALATRPELARTLQGLRLTGDIDMDNMRIVEQLARDAGLRPSDPTWFGEAVDLPEALPASVRRAA